MDYIKIIVAHIKTLYLGFSKILYLKNCIHSSLFKWSLASVATNPDPGKVVVYLTGNNLLYIFR